MAARTFGADTGDTRCRGSAYSLTHDERPRRPGPEHAGEVQPLDAPAVEAVRLPPPGDRAAAGAAPRARRAAVRAGGGQLQRPGPALAAGGVSRGPPRGHRPGGADAGGPPTGGGG